MKHHLLDTNICVHFLRQRFDVDKQISRIGWRNCCISEITVAELLYGAESSNDIEKNIRIVTEFCDSIEVLPIRDALTIYSRQKVMLRRQGTPIEDLDLLIGATAIAYDCVMVTENVRHLHRLQGIDIENWIKRD